jgi:hypothetical protein
MGARQRHRATEVLDAEEIESGTNLLVSGSAMSGKHELVLSLLAAGEADGSVFVTTRKDAVASERDFERLSKGSQSEFSVVDCVSRSAGFDRPTETPGRVYVSDPGDLTGIGIAATKFLRQFYTQDVPARLGVHSVSTMLMYADVKRVFRFLHVLTGRISSSGFIGVFALDDTVDEREQSVLRQPFDGVVELRETDEGRELRCRGADVGPRSWTPVNLW